MQNQSTLRSFYVLKIITITITIIKIDILKYIIKNKNKF